MRVRGGNTNGMRIYCLTHHCKKGFGAPARHAQCKGSIP